jgi:hypothetical protein
MPQAAASDGLIGVEVRAGVPVANTDSCFSRDVLLHEGHSTVVDARTSVSKRLLHPLQTYSNIGIRTCSNVVVHIILHVDFPSFNRINMLSASGAAAAGHATLRDILPARPPCLIRVLNGGERDRSNTRS